MMHDHNGKLDDIADGTHCHDIVPHCAHEYLHTLLDPENATKLGAITPFVGQSASLVRLTTVQQFEIEQGEQLNVVAIPNVQQLLWTQSNPGGAFRGNRTWVDQAWHRVDDPNDGIILGMETPVFQDPSYTQYEVSETHFVGQPQAFVPLVSPATDYAKPGFLGWTPDEADLASYPFLQAGQHLAVRIRPGTQVTLSVALSAAAGTTEFRGYYLDSAGQIQQGTAFGVPSGSSFIDVPLPSLVDSQFIIGFTIQHLVAGIVTMQRMQVSGETTPDPEPLTKRRYMWTSRPAGAGTEVSTLDDNFTNYFPVAMSLRVTWASSNFDGGRVFAARNQYRDNVFLARGASLVDETSLGIQHQHYQGNAHEGAYAVWTPATTADFEFRPWRQTYRANQSSLAAQVSINGVGSNPVGIMVVCSFVVAIQTPSQIWSPSLIENARDSDLQIIMQMLRQKHLVTENPLHLRKMGNIMKAIKRAIVNNYHYVRPIVKGVIASTPAPLSVPLSIAESAANDAIEHERRNQQRVTVSSRGATPRRNQRLPPLPPTPPVARQLSQRAPPVRRRLRNRQP